MKYTILVVLEDSRHSLKAVKRAGFLASQISEAVVRLLYVYPLNNLDARAGDYQTLLKKESAEVLNSAKTYLERLNISYEEQVCIGNLTQEISIAVQKKQCDMVVLNYTSLQIYQELMCKVDCPVLVVPDTREEVS